ncbi:MAG TPA: hypothetical protein VMI56_18035 [Reyranella sp.]|nr:hypothetical protein [Reyranella sp.]
MTDLSTTELDELRALAGAMIPANTELGMPGAGDPLIMSDIARSIGRDLPLVREALRSFGPGQDINDWYVKGGVAAATLGRLVLGAYYRDDRVLVAVGHEARAPFPKGHEVEQGDWSLLDAVRHRRPLWRDDRAGKR